MKPLWQHVRTTIAGGILFLGPLVVLAIILGKALTFAQKIVSPLAERLPFTSIVGLKAPVLLAIGLILVFCFLAGVLAKTVLAKRLVGLLESALLSNIPGYEFFKERSASALGVKSSEPQSVVLARIDESWQIGLHIENLANGLLVVFVPDAPSPYSGAVHFLSSDRVIVTDIPVKAALKCLKRIGAGASELLRNVQIPAAPKS